MIIIIRLKFYVYLISQHLHLCKFVVHPFISYVKQFFLRRMFVLRTKLYIILPDVQLRFNIYELLYNSLKLSGTNVIFQRIEKINV